LATKIATLKSVLIPRVFFAEVLVNHIRYEGRGASKAAAKNDASEKALRDLIIQKMVERPKKGTAAENNDTPMDSDDAEMNDDSKGVEVPMMHLASYALHKLFSEWQNDGFEIPDLKTTNKDNIVPPKASADKSDLPPNHENMHPSMLLSMMRPNTQYVDLGSEGTTPNVVHRFGVTVDGKSFVGHDRTKKLARKAAATAACNSCFGTKFQQEEIRVVANKKAEDKFLKDNEALLKGGSGNEWERVNKLIDFKQTPVGRDTSRMRKLLLDLKH